MTRWPSIEDVALQLSNSPTTTLCAHQDVSMRGDPFCLLLAIFLPSDGPSISHHSAKGLFYPTLAQTVHYRANCTTWAGSTYVLRSDSPPPLLAAESARFGSTQMKSMRSRMPTPVKLSANSSLMALLSANKSPCTRVLELGN